MPFPSARFRLERSEDRVTSSRSSASSSASRSHSACQSLESTEFRARAPATPRGVSIASNAMDGTARGHNNTAVVPNAQRAARRGFAFYLPPALKIPSPRGLGRVATSEARRLVSRHARPFPSAGEAPAFRAFEPGSRRRNPTPRPHVPGFRSNGFARVRKRCPSARRPRSRRGTPTRSTTASMTTTEGCVRFERAAPREAGDGPERRADSSRETINDPSATHRSSSRWPHHQTERKPKKATD